VDAKDSEGDKTIHRQKRGRKKMAAAAASENATAVSVPDAMDVGVVDSDTIKSDRKRKYTKRSAKSESVADKSSNVPQEDISGKKEVSLQAESTNEKSEKHENVLQTGSAVTPAV